jgi:hypothetical protein
MITGWVGNKTGDFYVMYQRENYFINKILQRRLNLKYNVSAVNNDNKTNGNT